LNQTQELSRVKARIEALTEKTVANGCTEAEVMSAAEMVGRLLERYALSMNEIEVRTARCVQVEVELGSRRRRPIDGAVPAIARFCDCKVWLSPASRGGGSEGEKHRPGIRYIFFGFETDSALAAYLFAVIDRAITTETAVFKRANPRLRAVKLRRASSSFQHGLVARVATRLTGSDAGMHLMWTLPKNLPDAVTLAAAAARFDVGIYPLPVIGGRSFNLRSNAADSDEAAQ
jgi:hypothetical protein